MTIKFGGVSVVIKEFMERILHEGGSDLHISVGLPPMMRKNGKMVRLCEERLMPKDTEALLMSLLQEDKQAELRLVGEVDFAVSLQGVARFRVNIFKQRNTFSGVMRVLNSTIPSMEELGLPGVVKELAEKQKGLVLVTGPTGSGKSTTLASMIDHINNTREGHILTLEDPIEYLHRHRSCIVNQREIGADSGSFASALRAALREDPDVILVGEMRDLDTIAITLTAAETGHLVLSTLHTVSAATTIDRIIDVFPHGQQQQIRLQVANVLQGVISQQLMSRADKKGRILAPEILVAVPAVRNLIREGKTHQIDTVIQTGGRNGMVSMDNSLYSLFKKGIITQNDFMMAGSTPESVARMLGTNIQNP